MDRNINKIVYVHIYDKPLWIKIKIVNHVTTFFIKTKIIIYFEDFWDEKLKSFRFLYSIVGCQRNKKSWRNKLKIKKSFVY